MDLSPSYMKQFKRCDLDCFGFDDYVYVKDCGVYSKFTGRFLSKYPNNSVKLCASGRDYKLSLDKLERRIWHNDIVDIHPSKWRVLDFIGAPQYAIIDDGRIWNFEEYRWVYGGHDGHGYRRVDISTVNGQVMYKIHRLVAMAFIPNPLNKPHINHKDGDPSNNNVTNLEWVTPVENMRHAFDTGLISLERTPDETIHAVCAMLEQGMTMPEVRKTLGIKSDTVHNIKNGITGKHISCHYDLSNISSSQKLSDDDVEEIRRRRLNGERGIDLAAEYGVHEDTICRIHLGRRRVLTTQRGS